MPKKADTALFLGFVVGVAALLTAPVCFLMMAWGVPFWPALIGGFLIASFVWPINDFVFGVSVWSWRKLRGKPDEPTAKKAS